jgi:hypothetical protein
VIAASTSVDLVTALAWPVATVAAVILLRKHLGPLLEEIGKRATRVSVFQFALDLATVPQLDPQWEVGGDDVRQLTSAYVFDAPTLPLFEELSRAGASEYVVVDLGKGDQWLSSRLYAFAVVLRRMSGLRSIVFTATKGDETGVFIGEADPVLVRWALAQTYPWLEIGFARAYADQIATQPPGTSPILSEEGALEPSMANMLVRAFLIEIQSPGAVPPAPGEPATPATPPAITPGPPQWIELPNTPSGQAPLWEHGSWLTVDLLEQIVGRSRLRPDLAFTDTPEVPTVERVKAVARRPGEFVALVTPSGRFTGMIDRAALLEAIARDYAEQDERR